MRNRNTTTLMKYARLGAELRLRELETEIHEIRRELSAGALRRLTNPARTKVEPVAKKPRRRRRTSQEMLEARRRERMDWTPEEREQLNSFSETMPTNPSEARPENDVEENND